MLWAAHGKKLLSLQVHYGALRCTTVHYGAHGSRIPPWQWFVRKQVDLSCPILSYLVLYYPVLPDPLRSNLYVIYLSIYGSICAYESTVNLSFCMSTYVSKHPSTYEQSIGMFNLSIYLPIFLSIWCPILSILSNCVIYRMILEIKSIF